MGDPAFKGRGSLICAMGHRGVLESTSKDAEEEASHGPGRRPTLREREIDQPQFRGLNQGGDILNETTDDRVGDDSLGKATANYRRFSEGAEKDGREYIMLLPARTLSYLLFYLPISSNFFLYLVACW